jgi:biopolymer transport protein ExbD
MIDVVFLLLVFFMLVSSWIDLGSIDLAVAPPAAGVSPFEGALLLRVWEQRSLDLNGQPVTLDQLGRRLHAELLREPNREIIVTPEAAVPLQRLVAVLDEVRGAGARRMSLRRR